MKNTPVMILAFGLTALAPAFAHAGPAIRPAADTAQAFSGGTGMVAETMSSGGYTYIKLDLGQGPVWVAAPEFKVSTGQTVSVPGGMPMHNFQSKTLNRTFDVVYFVSAVQVQGTSKKKP